MPFERHIVRDFSMRPNKAQVRGLQKPQLVGIYFYKVAEEEDKMALCL